MSTALDFKSIPGITKEMREELVATFDAMSNWRDEIETVNKRCMGKVVDQTSRLRAQWVGPIKRSERHESIWKRPPRCR